MAARGLVVHTIVSTDLKRTIATQGRLHSVETIDLMGPILAQLAQHLSDSPAELHGLFRRLNREYFQRIEAVEFAVRHDDGQRSHELANADIVLLGVSRTFQTPLSIYLAFNGWMVGNVPIVAGLPLPSTVFEIPHDRIVGLTMRAHNLQLLRRVRHDYLGGNTGSYAELRSIKTELDYANRIFNYELKRDVIDVTNKPIEELANEILSWQRQRVEA